MRREAGRRRLVKRIKEIEVNGSAVAVVRLLEGGEEGMVKHRGVRLGMCGKIGEGKNTVVYRKEVFADRIA